MFFVRYKYNVDFNDRPHKNTGGPFDSMEEAEAFQGEQPNHEKLEVVSR